MIDKNKYRIVEKTFGDGHKEYKAQEVMFNFGLFKIWKDFVVKKDDYGYGVINWLCCGESYNECKEYLLKSIENHQKENMKQKIVNKVFYKI